jgi:hypothetical protein
VRFYFFYWWRLFLEYFTYNITLIITVIKNVLRSEINFAAYVVRGSQKKYKYQNGEDIVCTLLLFFFRFANQMWNFV